MGCPQWEQTMCPPYRMAGKRSMADSSVGNFRGNSASAIKYAMGLYFDAAMLHTYRIANRFRKRPVRFEKLQSSYEGLLMFACAFIAFRKADVI
jgi:hypothetical protein